jgi:hypothetical protein
VDTVEDVARVDRATGEVVNVERASAEWVRAQGVDVEWLYVTVDDTTGPAPIGGRWNHDAGRFEPAREDGPDE